MSGHNLSWWVWWLLSVLIEHWLSDPDPEPEHVQASQTSSQLAFRVRICPSSPDLESVTTIAADNPLVPLDPFARKKQKRKTMMSTTFLRKERKRKYNKITERKWCEGIEHDHLEKRKNHLERETNVSSWLVIATQHEPDSIYPSILSSTFFSLSVSAFLPDFFFLFQVLPFVILVLLGSLSFLFSSRSLPRLINFYFHFLPLSSSPNVIIIYVHSFCSKLTQRSLLSGGGGKEGAETWWRRKRNLRCRKAERSERGGGRDQEEKEEKELKDQRDILGREK